MRKRRSIRLWWMIMVLVVLAIGVCACGAKQTNVMESQDVVVQEESNQEQALQPETDETLEDAGTSESIAETESTTEPEATAEPEATPEPTAEQRELPEPEEGEVILFESDASVEFTSWDNWEKAVSLESNEFDLESIEEPFSIKVVYESDAVPMLIFMSWTGGNGWAQMTPFYASDGVAYYTYDVLCNSYGADFSNLDRIQVMPYAADLTVSRISIVPEVAKEEIDVTYSGRAGKFVNDITAGWNLGNTLDSCGEWIDLYTAAEPIDFEKAWGNPETTEKMIQDVKAAGFNAIRVPVTWSQHVDEENGYQIDEAWMARVQEIVDYVVDNDMYCILNVHHDTGTDAWLRASEKNVEQNGAKFTALWKQIAEKFKDYDDRLVFEGFNEILNEDNNWGYPGTEGTAAVNTLNQMFVDTVRATGGNNANRVLVINTYAASTDNGVLDEFVVPVDTVEDCIVVGMHFYNPISYCFEISDNDNTQAIWTENGGKSIIDGMLYSAYMHFTRQGIPVIISEYGVSNKDNESDRAQWAGYLVESAKQHGIKCFYWDNGGTFDIDAELGYYKGMALYNRYKEEWVFPEIVEAITE